jgi:hypothetical protein
MPVPIGGPPPPESYQSGSPAADLTSRGLRDFLLNHVLGIGHAVTTPELRHRAAVGGYCAELVERVYFHLVTLQRQGHIVRVWARGRLVYWATAQTEPHLLMKGPV